MKTQLVLHVITEQNLSLLARLLLILNRKQVELAKMQVNSDYSEDFYKYHFIIRGSSNILKQTIKVITKQIGVFDVKVNTQKVHQKQEAVLV